MALLGTGSEATRELFPAEATFRRTWTRQSIGNPIIRRRDPGWLNPIIMLNLRKREDSGHLEASVVGRPSILDEVEARGVVSPYPGVLVVQFWTPDSSHQDMREQFQI